MVESTNEMPLHASLAGTVEDGEGICVVDTIDFAFDDELDVVSRGLSYDRYSAGK